MEFDNDYSRVSGKLVEAIIINFAYRIPAFEGIGCENGI